jgi:[protein-PII] uridylyltransferase
MVNPKEIKIEYQQSRDKIFNDPKLINDPFAFSLKLSFLVEEFIIRILKDKHVDGAVASTGSFSRRELAPYSDIDIMFIFPKIEENKEVITQAITLLWDCGIEVSHTLREFSDIKKFLKEDLHTFTQFFETRFIYGKEKIYSDWNKEVIKSIKPKDKVNLIYEFFSDINMRREKYGESAKTLEPNIKFSAGGLRDMHVVNWIYALKNDSFLDSQSELTHTEDFLNIIKEKKLMSSREIERLRKSYKLILGSRNLLHLLENRGNDRLEFSSQEKIAKLLDYSRDAWNSFMQDYFEASTILNRFSKTMVKRFDEEISNPLPDNLSIQLDEDFSLKGDIISKTSDNNNWLEISEILRAFYYRGLNDARFDENLRSLIIESVQEISESEVDVQSSSVFFREILKLPNHVGKTLSAMNELGVLAIYLPEFRDLIGFFQPGVYHCYTADEHTLIAIKNLENLVNEKDKISKIYTLIKEKDLLFLAVIFHDIAKPVSISGHEIIGSEIASTVMERLGYDQDEIDLVQFLVRHHLTMEQVAFRRNINDASTLNGFAEIFSSKKALDYLYLLTYADLSAVSPVVWTQWKDDLLYELYDKTKQMMEKRISGEELFAETIQQYNDSELSSYSEFQNHIESINDVGYLQLYSREEISEHIEEILSGSESSVFFKENSTFTNITVIARDSVSLLSRLCGALAVNDLNIHDAKIFTRNDGIVIDSFNVTDFRTHEKVNNSKYNKIIDVLKKSINNELKVGSEVKKLKSKWWRLESKLFTKKSKVRIEFEDHPKFTIVDVYSPDKLGLLYQITNKLSELGLSIYFAKIATRGDDVLDAFYVLDSNEQKISPLMHELIEEKLKSTIEELL